MSPYDKKVEPWLPDDFYEQFEIYTYVSSIIPFEDGEKGTVFGVERTVVVKKDTKIEYAAATRYVYSTNFTHPVDSEDHAQKRRDLHWDLYSYLRDVIRYF